MAFCSNVTNIIGAEVISSKAKMILVPPKYTNYFNVNWLRYQYVILLHFLQHCIFYSIVFTLVLALKKQLSLVVALYGKFFFTFLLFSFRGRKSSKEIKNDNYCYRKFYNTKRYFTYILVAQILFSLNFSYFLSHLKYFLDIVCKTHVY